MVRGWILFSCLTLGVIFRLWKSPDKSDSSIPKTGFLFTERVLDTHSWVYFFMESLIAIATGMCILNPKIWRDTTPNFLIVWYIVILAFDLFHFVGWFRDETIGWNLVKMVLFMIPLLWIQLKQLWQQ